MNSFNLIPGEKNIYIYIQFCYLDQLGVLVWELAVGQLVSADNPWVFENLLSSQSLMGVNVKHLGHQVLQKAK